MILGYSSSGESGTYFFRQAVWSALMISSAITISIVIILVENDRSMSLLLSLVQSLFAYPFKLLTTFYLLFLDHNLHFL